MYSQIQPYSKKLKITKAIEVDEHQMVKSLSLESKPEIVILHD